MWSGFLIPFCFFACLIELWPAKSPETEPHLGVSGSVLTALCLLLCAHIFLKGRPRHFSSQIAKITPQDILALRELEKHLAPGERLAVAFDYAKQGEKWIGPTGEQPFTPVYADVPLLFFFYLGAGVEITYSDVVSKLCGPADQRQKYLAMLGVKRFLFRGAASNSQEYFKRMSLCQISLSDFGFKYPSSYSDGFNSLYEIKTQDN